MTRYLRPIYKKSLHKLNYFYPSTNIFSRDWDLCVILDACRFDVMTEVAPEYDFLSTSGWVRSADSMTEEWLGETFIEKYRTEIEDTVYITGNPFARNLTDPVPRQIHHVWKYAWDEQEGTVLPRPITERTISVHREISPDRTLVHYMQPHIPFVKTDLTTPKKVENFGGGGNPHNIWDRLQSGEVSEEQVWDAYVNNLKYVLDDISLLLKNVDADKAVITSDHGNAFGEWGLYGHPVHMPIGVLRKVPWFETTGVDQRTIEPNISREKESDKTVDERLRDLGYKS